jgi:hypothetical protein
MVLNIKAKLLGTAQGLKRAMTMIPLLHQQQRHQSNNLQKSKP